MIFGTGIAAANAKRRRVLEYIYDNYPVGVDVAGVSSKRLGVAAGANENTGDDAVRLFANKLGLIDRRMAYKERSNNAGRVAHWTIKYPREEGLARFDEWATKHLEDVAGKQKAGLLLARKAPKVKAPPKRKVTTTAAEKLIQQARDYTQRSRRLNDHIVRLRQTANEIGATIDEPAIRNALQLVPNEELETIAKILPYVDSLEEQLAPKQTTKAGMEIPVPTRAEVENGLAMAAKGR